MRGDWYDSTALPWINPSPNMRSLTEATLYPGVGLVEGTNVSVGRGTDTPFELLGAPWIKAAELSQYLNARNISGVRFVPVTFTPNASIHAGQKCEGVNIFLIDRNALDAAELGIELASALHKLYPEQYHMERLIELLDNQSVYDAIASGPGSPPHRRGLAGAPGKIPPGPPEVPDLQVAVSLRRRASLPLEYPVSDVRSRSLPGS